MKIDFENLSDGELITIEGGAYKLMEQIVYGLNYAVGYVSEKVSQGIDRSIQNLDEADRNTLYGHYGGARP